MRTVRRVASTVGRLLLRKHRVFLVGSVLTKSAPRDLDLVMPIPDADFERLFGEVGAWSEEGRTGQWTAIRYHWSDVCVWLSHELERRLGIAKSVDLKIVPASMPDYGAKLE